MSTEGKNVKPYLVIASGLLLLMISMASVTQTGSVIARAHSLVTDAQHSASSTVLDAIESLCAAEKKSSIGGLCQSNSLPNGVVEATFKSCLAKIAPSSTIDVEVLSAACNTVWTEALRTVDTLEKESFPHYLPKFIHLIKSVLLAPLTMFGANGATVAANSDLSVVVYYVLAIVSLTLILLGLGKARSKYYLGVLINDRGRLSLSRFQVAMWTLVLVPAFAIYASFNIGVMASAWLESTAHQTHQLFPTLPGWTWAVMGITISSPALSAMLRGLSPEAGEEFEKSVKEEKGFLLKPVINKTEARMSDLILGEYDTDSVDITRAQLLILTIILIWTYCSWMVISMGDISTFHILKQFPDAQAILHSLPEPSAVFTGLLAITHGVYITNKWQIGKHNPATSET